MISPCQADSHSFEREDQGLRTRVGKPGSGYWLRVRRQLLFSRGIPCLKCVAAAQVPRGSLDNANWGDTGIHLSSRGGMCGEPCRKVYKTGEPEKTVIKIVLKSLDICNSLRIGLW